MPLELLLHATSDVIARLNSDVRQRPASTLFAARETFRVVSVFWHFGG
jgi:hypothetical protein